jgi:hypothetical protein
MLENHDRLSVFEDFETPQLNDVCLIDPHSVKPVIWLLFERRNPAARGTYTRPAIAVLIENAHSLATMLGRQFIERTKALDSLSPNDLRDLAKTYLYFAWGVHMAPHKMLSDVPDAHPRGAAVLPRWRRNISAMLAGPADRSTIRRTNDKDDAFDGVAYELSWWGKKRLHRLESRAYQEVEVKIEIDGHQATAFTYLPWTSSPASEAPKQPGSWIWLVIEGAKHFRLENLLAELRARGVVETETL